MLTLLSLDLSNSPEKKDDAIWVVKEIHQANQKVFSSTDTQLFDLIIIRKPFNLDKETQKVLIEEFYSSVEISDKIYNFALGDQNICFLDKIINDPNRGKEEKKNLAEKIIKDHLWTWDHTSDTIPLVQKAAEFCPLSWEITVKMVNKDLAYSIFKEWFQQLKPDDQKKICSLAIQQSKFDFVELTYQDVIPNQSLLDSLVTPALVLEDPTAKKIYDDWKNRLPSG